MGDDIKHLVGRGDR